MNRRRLALRRESLTPLTTTELDAVAGGDSPTWQPSCMNNCASLDKCPTIPIRECKIYLAVPITTVLEGTA